MLQQLLYAFRFGAHTAIKATTLLQHLAPRESEETWEREVNPPTENRLVHTFNGQPVDCDDPHGSSSIVRESVVTRGTYVTMTHAEVTNMQHHIQVGDCVSDFFSLQPAIHGGGRPAQLTIPAVLGRPPVSLVEECIPILTSLFLICRCIYSIQALAN